MPDVKVEIVYQGDMGKSAIAAMMGRVERTMASAGKLVQNKAISNMPSFLQKYGGLMETVGPTNMPPIIDVQIGVFKPGRGGAGMMAAHEMGSGLYRSKGSPDKYPIDPKNAPRLVFLWPYPPWGYILPYIKQIPMPGGPLVFLKHVDHPGVKPHHYLGSAFNTLREQIIKMIRQAVTE